MYWGFIFLFLECKCNENGSDLLECGNNGECVCKDGFRGKKCDQCKPNITGESCDKCKTLYFGYPNCQGLFIAIEDFTTFSVCVVYSFDRMWM